MEAAASKLLRDGGIAPDFQRYFLTHRERLHASAEIFGLWSQPALGDVLEIGPFYGLLPFFLRQRASSYTVLEGDDPAVYPLQPLYTQHGIALELVDLFDDFGPVRGAPNTMRMPDERFDTILCWETMEHFNFNPVKFVRDLHRLLKPGGVACITVPNRALAAEPRRPRERPGRDPLDRRLLRLRRLPGQWEELLLRPFTGTSTRSRNWRSSSGARASPSRKQARCSSTRTTARSARRGPSCAMRCARSVRCCPASAPRFISAP